MSPKPLFSVIPGYGGWCFVQYGDAKQRVYVRVEWTTQIDDEEWKMQPRVPGANSLEIMEIFIDGDGAPLTADFLRGFPLAAVESVMQNIKFMIKISELMDESHDYMPDFNPARDLSHFQGLQRNRNLKLGKIERPYSAAVLRRRMKLNRPQDGRLSDPFLMRVAKFYQEAVAFGEHPVVEIAFAAGVPPKTASRWVGLARKKEFLPPGKSGKVS